MAKTSFTVHLSDKEGAKLELMREENPDFSRNALIRLAISEFELSNEKSPNEINALMRHINALHKQLNPQWKRKKSLPYHFADEYAPVANYTEFHGDGK